MATTRPEVDEPLGPFDIYETMDGPRHVVNPVRRQILAKMRGVELTVPEIIEATHLTKSTISTHLHVLYRQRMVAYREDPIDRRRKRYYLTARHVASSRRCADRTIVHRPGELAADDSRHAIPRVLLRAFVAELHCSGLDVAPVARETGRRVGELAARQSGAASDLDAWVKHAALFWAQAGLGELRAVASDPLTLRIDDCGLCCGRKGEGVSLCLIAAGILEGMACESLRASVRVTVLGDGGGAANTAKNGRRAEGGSAEPATARCGCTFGVHVEAGLV